MPAMRRSASTIQGQTGADDVAAGTGEDVADGPSVTEVGPLVSIVGEGVEGGADVFVGVLVEGGGDDVEVRVDVGVLVGASLVGDLVGAVAVREAVGVRVGSAGMLTERDALGRFEPPPHAAISSSPIAQSAIGSPRIRRVPVASPFQLSTHHPRRLGWVVGGGGLRLRHRPDRR